MTSRFWSAAALSAAVALAPLPAAARDDDDRREHRRHRHHHSDRKHDDHGHRRGDRHGWRDHRHHAVRYHGSWCEAGWARGVRHARAPYWCGPCGHGFGDRGSFHRHVHHHHHVPWDFVPHVVVQLGFGWIFHG